MSSFTAIICIRFPRPCCKILHIDGSTVDTGLLQWSINLSEYSSFAFKVIWDISVNLLNQNLKCVTLRARQKVFSRHHNMSCTAKNVFLDTTASLTNILYGYIFIMVKILLIAGTYKNRWSNTCENGIFFIKRAWKPSVLLSFKCWMDSCASCTTCNTQVLILSFCFINKIIFFG